jgi:uncharacterized protein YndB with AHSA1/START domain
MTDTPYADKGVYQVLINAPIETVWSELVKTGATRPFFWDSAWDTHGMAEGNTYRMISSNRKTVAVIGEILEMEPPHRLVTSFRLTSLDDPPSRVTYELEEAPEGTLFTLITENVPAGSRSEKSMADGSRFIVTNFKSFIETGKVTFGARMLLSAFRLMAPFTPKSMSADKWPLDR